MLLLAGLLASNACHLQDLTPAGSRRDEAAVQSVVSQFYAALAARNTVALDSLSVRTATVLVAGGDGAVVVPLRAAIDVPERRNQNGGARVARVELHPDGDVASDRVVVVTRSRDGRREFEATDLLTLARRGSAWRVAHIAMGQWRARTAP